MHSRLEMSLMGEMKFCLGLQIHQSPRGIFINQAKYALEILHKHGMDKGQSIGTPMATKPKLDADFSGNPVDQTDYRSKIGSFMYLTSSRPDIVQAVCFCARYQSRLTEKHLKEVKRIFPYLKGTINKGLWYPKDSSFGLTAFSDADHARCIDTRKSTDGGIQFIGDKLVSWMSKKQDCTAMSLAKAKYMALSASCAQEVFLQRKLILTMRISTILGLELFLQDIQSFELKEKDSVRIIKIEILLEPTSNKLLVVKMEILLEPTSNKLLVGLNPDCKVFYLELRHEPNIISDIKVNTSYGSDDERYDPDCAFMSADMYFAVKGVATYFPTTIISGRRCDKETSTNDCSSYVRSTELGYYSLKGKYSGVRFTVLLGGANETWRGLSLAVTKS
nr:retrovirus-related Pol polyprotein from transposon TNT 1-94 [Tanacetum cinerariifolium]